MTFDGDLWASFEFNDTGRYSCYELKVQKIPTYTCGELAIDSVLAGGGGVDTTKGHGVGTKFFINTSNTSLMYCTCMQI